MPHSRIVIQTLPVVLLTLLFAAGCDTSTVADPALQMTGNPTVGEPHSGSAENSLPEMSDDTPAAGRFVASRLLVKFRPGTAGSDKMRILEAANSTVVEEMAPIDVVVVELPPGASESAQRRAFQSEPCVEYAEYDRVHEPQAITPNDTWYFGQWHLPRISAPDAWAMTTGSADVIIAICDTGVDASHPDLMDRLIPGWNAWSQNSDTSDPTGHGTAVAGIAAASSNNAIGVASIAGDCRIMPIRIGNATGATTSSVIANGMIWAADHGARVVNISFGVLGSPLVSSAAQYLHARGGVVTSSAGNEGIFLDVPDDPYVLTISATDVADQLAGFSNYGPFVDLAAPGAGIYTTKRGGNYASASGTSFACPNVAGVAALMISANPNLTSADVQAILRQSCDDLGPQGWDETFSWGRLNAAAAVSMAIGYAAPVIDITPPLVSIESPVDHGVISRYTTIVVDASDNEDDIASVELRIDGNPWASDTAPPYAFVWNTTQALNGEHTIEAVSTDTAGNVATDMIDVVVHNVSDDSPPVVSIKSVRRDTKAGNLVFVDVGTGNTELSRVELYVDGAIRFINTRSPFSTVWNASRSAPESHTLVCKAYSRNGTVGVSEPLIVDTNAP